MAEKLNNRLLIVSIVIGTLASIGYLFEDFLYYEFWLLPAIITFMLSLWLIINIAKSIVRKQWKTLFINLSFVFLVVLIQVGRSEYFKSPKLLEATLNDELSAIGLVLRQDMSFEVQPVSFIGEERPFKGNYKINGHQLIFLSPPYDNDFIPDTVLFYKDKIIMNGDIQNPDTSFARFFEIRMIRKIRIPKIEGTNPKDTTHQFIYNFMKTVIRDQKLDLSYGLLLEPDPYCSSTGDDQALFESFLIKSPRSNSLLSDSIIVEHGLQKNLTDIDIWHMMIQKERYLDFVWDNTRLGFDLSNNENWYQISVPIFSLNKKTAFIKIECLCPGLCGVGSIEKYSLEDGKWRSKTIQGWWH
jgi:hypothetical protein